MSILDNVLDDVKAVFSDWIKITDPKSKWTIEDFPEEKGVNENVTNRHCWRCVSVNQCWFKNEDNKKPDEYDYSQYSQREISYYIRGLFHPHCHDKKSGINVPHASKIIIRDVRDKFNNLFQIKGKIFRKIGYTSKDENDIIEIYLEQVKRKYVRGEYYKFRHTKYGFQINIEINMPVKTNMPDDLKTFKTGLIIFPNGQLRIVTVFAGRK